LGQLVGRITEEIAYTELQALNPLAYTSFAEVEAVFVVNAAGDFIYPPQLPLRLAARRPLFAEAMRRGGLLEFEQQDSKAAAVFYEQLLQTAESEAESAEVLNALGRCALKAENSKLAIEIQTKLRRHLFTLDADGTHPATLHLLRLAQYWGYGRGSTLLEEQVRGILAGRQPLHPGSRTALLETRALVRQWQEQGEDCVDLMAALAQLERRMDLLRQYEDMLRRATAATKTVEQTVLTFGTAVVDFARFEATIDGAPVHLSPKEFEILKLLWREGGNAVSRSVILQQVWGYDVYPTTRTVDTHVVTLRAKLEEDAAQPIYLLTVHGIGCRLVIPA
jgi:DNA-binding winged helix-turn-helix (wHTH) protein